MVLKNNARISWTENKTTVILKQIDNPNRLCDTINLRVKLRLVDKPEGQVSVGGQIIPI